ncbi:MAG TPA: hypothetical protein PKC42_04115 [Candidatus Nanoperiomorbaceae bacterium]|nr:hypothetical protein [Candidatus Nanoperiomorbaceae bacterium]
MIDTYQESAVSYKTARFLKLMVLLVIIVALNVGGTWLSHLIDFQLFPRHEPMLHAIVLVAVILYIVLMATPFMPGIEIGLALMMLLGNKGAILVYLCTLAALSVSFAIGRKIPSRFIGLLLNWLHLYKASALVRQLESLNQQERLEFLSEKAPSRIAPFLLRHRYLAIAVVVNLPGNALIGGGGGIGLVAGMSKIIPFHGYLMVLAIAIAPVPLWFFLQGS